VYAKSPGGVLHYFISVREDCFSIAARLLLPLTHPVWRGSSPSFPRGAFQQNLFPARTSYLGSEAEEDLQRSKEKAVLLRFWLGQMTRQQLLCLLLVFLCAAGSKIASAATNPQDGNYFFFFCIILVNFRCRKHEFWPVCFYFVYRVSAVFLLFLMST
jgi:hypothetical protein